MKTKNQTELETSRKQASSALRKEAVAEHAPHSRIHGYDVYFEDNGKDGWNSYSPTLLGCGSWGETLTECKRNMAEAIELHISGMEEDGEAVPPRDGRGKPRYAARRGRTVSISSRVSPEAAASLERISKQKGISKTAALEEAIALYEKKTLVRSGA